MSITVIRGLVGRESQVSNEATNSYLNQITQGTQQASNVLKNLSQDAVVSSIKTQRVSFAGDKLRDLSEARELADKVAEGVRSLDKEDAGTSHAGLSERVGSASALLK